MSYILDALRRADAERERGRVPGIHAHSTHGPADEATAPRAPSPWRWVAMGVGLALLAVLGLWVWLGHDDPPPGPPPGAAMTPPPPIPAAQAPDRAPRPPPSQSATPRPVELPAPAVANEPLRTPIEQRPTAAEVAAAARLAAAAASRPAASAAASKPAAAASAPGDARVYARHELPEEIRRQLPAVTVGGSIYSPTPANRFVVINGQVVHEGGEIGPEHVLETIRLKSAVLRFKGYRYEILF
jgi:general secretion pathway protein B